MKKLLVVLVGVLVLMSTAAFAQDTYYVNYFANNGANCFFGSVTTQSFQVPADQQIRIINVGVNGNPLTDPVGDICAQVYVFDNNQEMVACCGCNITPNGLASAWVGLQLTSNPVTSLVPPSGVIKVALLNNPTGGNCDPTAPLAGANASLGVVFGTHINTNVSGGIGVNFTETQGRSSPLSAAEETFLPTSCSFALYLGSGKGTCSCSETDELLGG